MNQPHHKDEKQLIDASDIIDDIKSELPRLASNDPLNSDFIDRSVAIICSSNIKLDPLSIKSGKTGAGTEEAIIEIAFLLAKQNYKVYIFGNINDFTTYHLPGSNPRFLYRSESQSKNNIFADQSINIISSLDDIHKKIFQYSIIVYSINDDIVARCKQLSHHVLFWSHNYRRAHFSFTGLDGLLVLSNYHKHSFYKDSTATTPHVICGNGFNPSHYRKVHVKRKHSCIYTSNYARGLEILLDIWEDVKKHVPDATLDICYGRNTWGSIAPSSLASIVKKIESLKDLDVREHERLSHDQVAELLLSTSIFSYPCIAFDEVYCISLVKAQAAGCIPVVSPKGALGEMLSPGIKRLPVLNSTTDPNIHIYKQELINALLHEDDFERDSLVEWTEDMTWEDSCKKITDFLELLANVEIS